MKRDMDLVRSILLAAEEADSPVDSSSLVSDDSDESAIAYHIRLMDGAGLVETRAPKYVNDPAGFVVTGLTWEGHDFLNAVRDDSTWRQAKARLGEKLGTVSFEIVKSVAVAVTKEALGLG